MNLLKRFLLSLFACSIALWMFTACTPLPLPAPSPIPTNTPSAPILHSQPGENGHPTLADFWEGRAEFVVDIADTGLPMGESETVIRQDGEWWSYVHASERSAGVVDQCGAPVDFPGCLVIYKSHDDGRSFQLENPVCQMACVQCPCDSKVDHIDQQQYPRVVWDGEQFMLVYEYRAMVMAAQSANGADWTPLGQLPATGIWHYWFRDCTKAESIGVHPFSPYDYQCLVGSPPGIYAEDGMLYVFVGLGQNPGAMGCYKGPIGSEITLFEKCEANPLFGGAATYGPVDEIGPTTNPYFDFRTISSAEIQRVGEQIYMLYEGVRGPGAGDGGDTQFGLGLARSLTSEVDGPWETFPGNPILVDLPGNVGLGHGDLVVVDGETLLYTSLDGEIRSRLRLVWK